jgi:hypothetical protein
MTRLPAFLSALILTSLLASTPGSARAEAVDPSTVRIHESELSPVRAQVEGRSFVLANRSSATARVQFDLPRGEGIFCHSPGTVPRSARKFLVDSGASLVCVTDPGRYDYTVFQSLRTSAGRFVQRQEDGRIELR